MLSADWLEAAPCALVEIYSLSEQDILAYMATRISAMDDFIPAAQWQYYKLREMGLCRDEIIKRLAKVMKVAEPELWKVIRSSGFESIKSDDKAYAAAGYRPGPADASESLKNALSGGYMNTRSTMENITRTTANTATGQFERALDRAWLNVNTGGFAKDEAVRQAVKQLSAEGVGAIQYPGGHIDMIDVAVTRAVRTGINQTALRMQMARAQEFGCDLVEVTAHAGARVGIGVANHAEWQGKIYSISGNNPKYPNFAEATGYGTGAGLGGWNCRHSFHPYFEGSPRMYSGEELQELNAEKYTYNGTKMTEYEATQKQRYIERQLRRWKREYKAMDAAGQDTTEAAGKIKKWQDTQKDFLKQTGLKTQSGRSQIMGFGRSEASKVKAINKKVASFGELSGATASNGANITGITEHFGERAVQRNVTVLAVRDALTNPLKVGTIRMDSEGRRSQRFTGKDATVNINPDTGQLITAWKTGKRK